MKPGTRRRVYSCATPETYKYFVAPDSAEQTWKELQSEFGSIQKLPGFNLLQIDAASFVLRATESGNPITVVPKRRSEADDDFVRLHKILKYQQELLCNE